jgi:hypothetical protein
MHHIWVFLKILIVVKLLVLAITAIVLFRPFIRGTRRIAGAHPEV